MSTTAWARMGTFAWPLTWHAPVTRSLGYWWSRGVLQKKLTWDVGPSTWGFTLKTITWVWMLIGDLPSDLGGAGNICQKLAVTHSQGREASRLCRDVVRSSHTAETRFQFIRLKQVFTFGWMNPVSRPSLLFCFTVGLLKGANTPGKRPTWNLEHKPPFFRFLVGLFQGRSSF